MNLSNLGSLEHCDFDQANYHLEKGLAGIKEAEAYVKLWNETRFTEIEMKTGSAFRNGIEFEIVWLAFK